MTFLKTPNHTETFMLLDINRYSFAVFAKETKALAALAWPMMLAQIAAVGLGFVDTVMAGGAGKADLAAVALGSAAFATVFITWMGVMAALNPVVSQLHGAGEAHSVGEAGRQGLWFGLLLGLAGMGLLLAAVPPFLWYLDLPQPVEDMLAQYLWFTAPAMPAMMLYRALHAYTTSLGRTQAVMWVSWAGLLLNIPLNYVFVYGKFGLPALGGAGCGLATMLVCWFEAAALWLYVKRAAFFRPFGLANGFSKPDPAMLRQLWQLGWPSGLSYFLEASLFTFIMFLIAKFGEDYVAAQQVVISLTGIIYMIPQALGAAVTVRVGFALGRRQKRRARYIAGAGIASGLALACCTMLLLMLLRRPLASVYTSDAAVRALAAQVLLFAALFQLFDFTQCIASYALRGYKITKAPMLIHGTAFWGFGLLPGWLLANFAALKIFGFWAALIFSLACAAVLLLWLLEKHSKAVLLDKGLS